MAATPRGDTSPLSGITIAQAADLALATLIGSRGRGPGLAAAIRDAFGCDLPDRPTAIQGKGITFLGVGPTRWLARSEHQPDGGAHAAQLSALCGSSAAVADQSDAYVALRIDGAAARATLVKGVAIDLHPSVFLAGTVAATAMGGINVVIWRCDSPGVPGDGITTPFAAEILVPRSYALSFRRWLEMAAAEFGLSYEPWSPPSP